MFDWLKKRFNRTKVLIVCTGNTCRSPMAKTILDFLASSWKYEIDSAGLAAIEGDPASINAIKAMKRMRLDLSKHRAKKITPALVMWADIILCMTNSHVEGIKRICPTANVRLLSQNGISDPFGGSEGRYWDCSREILAALESFLRFANWPLLPNEKTQENLETV